MQYCHYLLDKTRQVKSSQDKKGVTFHNSTYNNMMSMSSKKSDDKKNTATGATGATGTGTSTGSGTGGGKEEKKKSSTIGYLSSMTSGMASGMVSGVSGVASGVSSGVSGAMHAITPGYQKPAVDDLDDPELTEETARRKEDALGYMLRTARNKYIARGLEGKITIQILYGVVTSGEFCTVTKNCEVEEDDDETTVNQLSSLNYKALSAMDTILANLVRRSKRYEAEDMRSGITLTQGIVFGISIPLVLSFGFQTSIYFEVTASSLISYRVKKEKLRVLKKKLKSIPNSEEMVNEVQAGGYSLGLAQHAICATEGRSVEEALRWATKQECGDEDMEEILTKDED